MTSVRINDGSAQRSRVNSITVTFDRPVVRNAGAFTVVGRNGAGAGVFVSSENPSGDGMTWVVTFDGDPVIGGSLPDGVYDLTVVAARVHAGTNTGPTMVTNYLTTFHRLFGDINGSGSVNNLDFGQFRNSFLKSVGDAAYNPAFDFDNSGSVNNADFGQFRGRYGKAFTY